MNEEEMREQMLKQCPELAAHLFDLELSMFDFVFDLAMIVSICALIYCSLLLGGVL